MGTATEVQHPSEIFSGIAATLLLLLQSFVTFLVGIQIHIKQAAPFKLVQSALEQASFLTLTVS
jgi:hypothetical protein